MALWQSERELRIAWERRPSTTALELEMVEFEEGTIWDMDGLRISAFAVDHRPVAPAFGFLFEIEGCRVAFSGDTTVCDNLVRRAAGVDLLVHECFIHQEMLARRGGRADEGLDNVAAYHTLSSAVGKVARRAGARTLLLNHFVPVDFDREALLAEVRADFAGPIVIGDDLLTIDVPRRVVSYEDYIRAWLRLRSKRRRRRARSARGCRGLRSGCRAGPRGRALRAGRSARRGRRS